MRHFTIQTSDADTSTRPPSSPVLWHNHFFFNCVLTKVELGERSQWLVMSLACSSKIHTKGSHFSKLTNFYPTTESLSLVAHVNFSQVWRGTWNKSYNYK